MGTLASILQLLKLPDGTIKILIEGIARAKVVDFTQNNAFFEAHAEVLSEQPAENMAEIDALVRSVLAQFEHYVRLNKRIGPEILMAVNSIKEADKLADVIATHLSLKIEDKQKLLEANSLQERLEMLFAFMEKEISVLQVERKIRKRVQNQMEKSQREYYLNEQMKAIQKELGDSEDGGDIQDLKEKIKKSGMPKEVKEKAEGELKKLQMMGPMSAEAGVIRNYVDWLVSIPWKQKQNLQT